MADAHTAPQPAAAVAVENKPAAAPPEMALASLLDVIVDEQTKRDLVNQEVERRTFQNQWNIARMFAKAGYFTDASDEFKAMAKIEIGRAWGLSAADSMRYVVIINGKPTVENEIVAAKLRRAGWNWEVQFIGSQGADCKGARLWIEKDGKPYLRPKRKDDGSVVTDGDGKPVMEQVSVEFTESQAKLVKVFEGGKQVPLLDKKGPWSDGWRANMYYWRAIAQLRRFHANDVMSGALLPDEIGDVRQENQPSAALSVIRGEIATTAQTAAASGNAHADEDREADWVKVKPRAATLSAIRAAMKDLPASVASEVADLSEVKTEQQARALLHTLTELAESRKTTGAAE